jgi:hypothetical protein
MTMNKQPTKNEQARAAGVPKWLRQYNARYGRGGVTGIIAAHLQTPAQTLDHGRDRANRKDYVS